MAIPVLSVASTEVLNPTFPSGILYYVPITVTNPQSIPTDSPFQQMIQVDSATYSEYEAPDLRNVEFFDFGGNIIPSWLQSGASSTATVTTYWLHLSNRIPAHSSVILYMGFAPKSSNLFNNWNVGEAPRLSATYGMYDDGKNVFLAYYNMSTNPVKTSKAGVSYYSIKEGSGPSGATQPLLTWTGTAPAYELASIPVMVGDDFPDHFSVVEWVQTDAVSWDVGIGSTLSSALYNGYAADPGAWNNQQLDIWKTTGNAWDYPVLASGRYAMNPDSWYTVQYTYDSGGTIGGSVEPFQNTINIPGPSQVSATDSSYEVFDSILFVIWSTVSTYTTRWALIVAYATLPDGVMPTTSFGVLSPTATISVTCTPSPLQLGSSSGCSATVTGNAPTGTVTWSTSGSGTFSHSSCSLSSGSCQTSYSPSNSASPVTITASYGGDANNPDAVGTFSLSVSKASSATKVECSPTPVMVGSPTFCTATVTGHSPSGNIAWSSSGGAFYSPAPSCTLSAQSCSVAYTPSSPTSPVAITAAYAGDQDNEGSSDTFGLVVASVTTTTSTATSFSTITSTSTATSFSTTTSTSTAMTSTATLTSTATSFSTTTSTSTATSTSTVTLISTSGIESQSSTTSAVSSSISSVQTTTSSSTSSGGGGGIPEFPYALTAVSIVTIVAVAAYLLVRRARASG